jgi:hypothetical protein
MSLPVLDERTRSAHWGWDEHRYFGYRVFAELTGRESLAGLLALSIVGRRLPPDCAALLDDAAAALTLADPRIWPLKLTRVLGAYGELVPAVAAGMLMQDHARIGPWACVEAAHALLALNRELGPAPHDAVRAREVVEAYLGERRFIWGFGTPFRARDERLVAFLPCVSRRGRDDLPYYKTMLTLTGAMRAVSKAEPNIGIAMAAVLLDMGLTPTQIGAVVIGLTQHMFFAHAAEAQQANDGVLRELPAAYVSYRGRDARVSPRARERDGAGANSDPELP